MKNKYPIGYLMYVFIFSCVSLMPSLYLSANQEQEHRKIMEKVTVTNIEVPVRVLYKGKPVDDLTKDDFQLYENKHRLSVNGFYMKRKKISMIKEQSPGETGKKRTFVLVFNVTKYNQYYARALDHLFDNILRSNDHLLILTNGNVTEYNRPWNKQDVKARLIADLKKESLKVKERLFKYVRLLESYVESHRIKIPRSTNETSRKPFVDLVYFLQKYQRTWEEYKRQFLKPKLDHFYYFARYLEKIKREKWVLNFYQFEVFPKIRPNSDLMERIRILSIALTAAWDPYKNSLGRLVEKMLQNLSIDIDPHQSIPNDEISKLFYEVDATFYSFFIRSTEFGIRDDFEFRELSSDIEKVLKKITQITGGENITSNDLVDSLKTVSEKEDIYYVLTYSPLDPHKSGKLKIKVKRKGKRYKVLYDNNFRPGHLEEYLAKLEEKIKTPEIKIGDFSFDRKTLAFTVKDFLMKMEASEASEKMEKVGKMTVRVRVTDKDNRPVYDRSKMLNAREMRMKISLDMSSSLQKGEYNFLIDAVDLLSGKEDNFYENIILK